MRRSCWKGSVPGADAATGVMGAWGPPLGAPTGAPGGQLGVPRRVRRGGEGSSLWSGSRLGSLRPSPAPLPHAWLRQELMAAPRSGRPGRP